MESQSGYGWDTALALMFGRRGGGADICSSVEES
jgi:hypothetical protein